MNLLLTSSLLTALLQSSLLVTGAWLLILTQRRTAAARRSSACRFTMAAALVLVAVIIGHKAFFLISDSKPISSQATLPQGAGSIVESTLLNSSESFSAEKPSSSPSVRSIAIPSSAGPLKLSAVHARWLGAAWLTGAALVLTAWLSSLAARWTLRERSQNGIGAPWLQCACSVEGWPLIDEVRVIPQEITPCVWGIWKTVLILPASASCWPAAKLKLVLAHECAHLLRRDPLWQILSRFFLAAFWFHPLAWNLARRSLAADEQAADDIVLRTTGNAPAYAELLVECARQFTLPPALQTTASAMAAASTLTRRVESVLNPVADRRPVNSAILLTWAAILSLLTAGACLAGPQVETAPAAPPASADSEKPGTPLPPDPTSPSADPDAPGQETPSPLFDPPIQPATAPPSATPPSETAAQEAPAKADTAASAFDWQPVSLKGRDYLPVSQIKNFYKFPRLSEEAGTFFLRSNTMVIKGASGSDEMSVNNVRFFLTYAVEASEDGPMISRHDLSLMLDPIIRPTYIKGYKTVTTVVIDAGHGGSDSGANGAPAKESTYTLDTAQRLQRQLKGLGLRTLLTRSDDAFLSVNERAALAAAATDAVFVSLHFGHGPATRQGIQTYFPEKAPAQPGPVDDTAYHASCVGLATAVHANALYKLRSTDGGIRSARFSVISGQTRSPAILIEGGYLSHPEEAARIATESYRQSLAEAIAGGLHNYIRARSKRTPMSR